MVEAFVAWTYLWGGSYEKRHLVGALASSLLIVLGVLLGFEWDQSSALALIAIGVGIVGLTLSILLYLMSVFLTVAVFGVVIGVSALVIVSATTGAFEKAFQDKILGLSAHVSVMKPFGALKGSDPAGTIIARQAGVVASQGVTLGEMQITSGAGKVSSMVLKGVSPMKAARVSNIESSLTLTAGDTLESALQSQACPRPRAGLGPVADELDARSKGVGAQPRGCPGLILGERLARKLGVRPGGEVTVVAPFRRIQGDSLLDVAGHSRSRAFLVTGVFRTGYLQFDQSFGITDTHSVQDFFGQGDGIYAFELKLESPIEAQAIAAELQQKLGRDYSVQAWQQLNRDMFRGLSQQRLVTSLIMMLIIVVAGFNLSAALTSTITDKTQDVAILMSMGASHGLILRMFLIFGVAIGTIGMTLGVSIGLGCCAVLDGFDFRLDPEVYLVDSIPIGVQFYDLLWIAGGTGVVICVATLLPSLRASALMPIDGLRRH